MTDRLRRWQFVDFGHDNLRLGEAPLPEPGPGQILVRVEAASLNYRDLLMAADNYGWTPPLPFTPGSDLAGIVQAVGPGVTRWQGGERVISTFIGGWIDGCAPAGTTTMGGPGPGVLASHVLLDAEWAVPAPASLTPTEASTLPCAALTAWYALFETDALRAGDTVLIHGTGGVALFGVQFAQLAGARTIVVSGGEDKRRRVLELGASHALARDGDWPAEVRRLTGGRGVDHVLETVGGANVGRSLSATAQGGHVSVIGIIDRAEFGVAAFDVIKSRTVIQGISVGHRRALQDMIRAIDANALKPVIESTYAFEDVPAAFEHLRRGAFGKLVVTF